MKKTHATIVRLLSNMASTREIELYLKRFSQLDAARFAVVKLPGAVLRDELAAIVSSLAFLQQVGLTPIVVHGAGPQVDQEMAGAGLERRLVEGVRFASPEVLAVVRRVLQIENLRLVEALQAEGVRATSISSGVFECEPLDEGRFGFVGRIREVHTAAIRAATAVGSIPVIASLGETAGGQILDLHVDHAAGALVRRIEPYKIIFLSEPGGLFDGRGRRIDSINLATEYADLVRQPWLKGPVRAELEQIHALLVELPPSTSLSITRPEEMAKELFTHRGSGTLVRRGEQIRAHDAWGELDTDRLRSLVESSFGKRLVDDYLERTKPYRIYTSEHYRAAIVLTREDGLSYMDKFAVTDEAQGEGLGRALWQLMRAENPELFWRSRRGNRVNDFYFAESDGAIKGHDWTVFWYGMSDWERIRRAVEHALGRPATLRD